MKKINKWMKKVTCAAVAGTMMINVVPPLNVQAAITAEQKAKLRQEMYQMIVTGDSTKHDVSKYKATLAEISSISTDLCKKEAAIPIRVTANQFVSSEKENGYVKYIFMYANDPGFQVRYEKVQSSIEEIMNKIEPEMSDLEKLIIVHDYIVEHTYYKNDTKTYLSYVLGGPLGEGYGSCTGYAEALIRVLWQLGIEADTVGNGRHGWAKVKIDGEWYHVDPTWADTRTRSNGETSHYFLMRNDNEYATSAYSPHASWGETVSTSTKYTDWDVHDIEGDMMYEDGMWYYESEGSICKNDIEGNAYGLVVAGTNMELVDIEDGVITYTEGGKTYHTQVGMDIAAGAPEQPPISTLAPTATSTPVPTATSTPVPTATSTPVPTATSTPVPTATSTPVPTATNTPVPTDEPVSDDIDEEVSAIPKYTPVTSVEILTNDWKNSYFDTGVELEADYDIECVFSLTSETSTGSVFGYGSNKGTHVYLCQCAADAVRVGYSWLYEWRACKPVGEINKYRKQGIAIYLNGKKVVNGMNMTYEDAGNLRLGTGKCKIYSTKIWDGSGRLIRDYVPALDCNGMIGMYDRVSDEFTYYTSNKITYEVD